MDGMERAGFLSTPEVRLTHTQREVPVGSKNMEWRECLAIGSRSNPKGLGVPFAGGLQPKEEAWEEWCVGGRRLYRAANSRRRSARAWRRYPTFPARRARPSTG